MVYAANWGIICHLPPFRGTRNNHWYIVREFNKRGTTCHAEYVILDRGAEVGTNDCSHSVTGLGGIYRLQSVLWYTMRTNPMAKMPRIREIQDDNTVLCWQNPSIHLQPILSGCECKTQNNWIYIQFSQEASSPKKCIRHHLSITMLWKLRSVGQASAIENGLSAKCCTTWSWSQGA